MKIVISKSQWEQIGRIAGWQDGYPQSTNPLNPTNPLNSTRMTLEDIWRNQTKNNIHLDDETMLEDFVRKAINANYSQAEIVEGLTEFYRQHAEVGTNIYNRVLERINKGRQSKESKRTGWYKTSMNSTHYMYVSLVDEMLFEDKKDVIFHMDDKSVDPKNVWEISYNNATFKSDILSQEMWDRYNKGEYGKRTPNHYNFYIQFFKAASVSARNFGDGTEKNAEEVVALIDGTCGINEFWDLNFIERNEQIMNEAKTAEESESKYLDDQLPGHYEEYGADKPEPQY